MKDELIDLARRAGWRGLDGFLSALVLDNLFAIALPEWKLAIAAAVSAALKPVTAYVAQKAGRS